MDCLQTEFLDTDLFSPLSGTDTAAKCSENEALTDGFQDCENVICENTKESVHRTGRGANSLSRMSIDGGKPNPKCRDCRSFQPITPGGLGRCENGVIRWTIACGYEGKQRVTWDQQVLSYPGQVACAEFSGGEII